MGTRYVYSIYNDTLNSAVDTTRLTNEIKSSDITIALDYINTDADDCDIWFKAELSAPEQVTLGELLAAHTGASVNIDPPSMTDGRPIVRADSRPLGYVTMFTMAGDTASGIGDGAHLEWDFSNDDNTISSGIEGVHETMKMKRLKISFMDSVYVKEGCLYFHDAKKHSYVDCSIVCPAGSYYYNRDGTPALASEDTVVLRYANKHHFSGDCPMGDELNTESATENALPSNYEIWLEVYVPETDNDSYGYGEFEMYRSRTYLLPGETP